MRIIGSETEFDIMFKDVLSAFLPFFSKDCISLGRRVGDKYQDIAIMMPYRQKEIQEARTIFCIEVKKQSTSGLPLCVSSRKKSTDLMASVRQALGYARAKHISRHDIVVRPVCCLTDGKFIAYLDSDASVEENIFNLLNHTDHFIFELDSPKFAQLYKDFRGLCVEDLVQVTENSIFFPRAMPLMARAETCDKRLANNLLKTHNCFREGEIGEEASIDYTMQCFLLAILRNCGFISVSEIDENLLDRRDHGWLEECLEKWFASNFRKVPRQHLNLFLDAYKTTRMYDVRTDAMPQEELGYAYEAFIRNARNQNDTEFYTPEGLIADVLLEVKPTKADVIFDPTCGCGSFLVAVTRKLFANSINNVEDLKNFREFLTKNIYGNDRDFYAVCITKASLLSLFVEKLGIDPQAVNLKMPAIKQNIEWGDFFNYKSESSKKFTLVIGNAPWGDVSSSSENFDSMIRNKVTWAAIQKVRGLGDDRHEISGSVVLKCLTDFGKNKAFRLGMLIKQQLLVKNKDKFLSDKRAAECYFFDYGPRELFEHTNSLTAVCFFNKEKKASVELKYASPTLPTCQFVKYNKFLSDNNVRQGCQTGKNAVWSRLGEIPELQDLCVQVIDRSRNTTPLQEPAMQNIVYLPPIKKRTNTNGTDPFRDERRLVSTFLKTEEKKELSRVTTGGKGEDGKKLTRSKTSTIAWRRPIDPSLIDSRWKVIFPNQFVNSDRLSVSVVSGPVIGRTSHTVMVFPNDCEDRIVFGIAGWMSTKLFKDYVEILASEQNIKRLSGGYELLPEYVLRLAVPSVLLNSAEFINVVRRCVKSSVVRTSDLNNLDQIALGLMSAHQEVSSG